MSHLRRFALALAAGSFGLIAFTVIGASQAPLAHQALLKPMVKFAPTSHALAAVQFDKPAPATGPEQLRRAVDEAIRSSQAEASTSAAQNTTKPIGSSIAGLGSATALQAIVQ